MPGGSSPTLKSSSPAYRRHKSAVPLLHCSWVPDDGQWRRLEATVSRAHQLSDPILQMAEACCQLWLRENNRRVNRGLAKKFGWLAALCRNHPLHFLPLHEADGSYLRHFTEFALIEPQTPPVQLWCGRSELASNLTFRHLLTCFIRALQDTTWAQLRYSHISGTHRAVVYTARLGPIHHSNS